MWLWRKFWSVTLSKDTCIIIGNGESRNIFGDLNRLKGRAPIYGCNAIYRDYPDLCDKIFCVNPNMYNEVVAGKAVKNFTADVIGPDKIVDWNYLVDEDPEHHVPKNLKSYRIWLGGSTKKDGVKKLDFTQARGSGCSAVLSAASEGYKNILIVAFDILGAEQWDTWPGEMSRKQNNIYKNTQNYASRFSMKAYLKYEWMYQLTQISRQYPYTKFWFINRLENITMNKFLPFYIAYTKQNFHAGVYANLQKFLDGESLESLKWILPA